MWGTIEKGVMSTLKISKHSDVPAALDLVREEVDKEARRVRPSGRWVWLV